MRRLPNGIGVVEDAMAGMIKLRFPEKSRNIVILSSVEGPQFYQVRYIHGFFYIPRRQAEKTGSNFAISGSYFFTCRFINSKLKC